MQHAPTWARRPLLAALILLTAAGFVASCTHDVALQPAVPNAAEAEPDLPPAHDEPPAPAVTGEEAIRQSLGSLAAHGLDPASYLSNTQSVRDAWLLAATHLARGVVDPQTHTARSQPDRALAAVLDQLPPESGPDDFARALQDFAPQSPIYAALQAELGRQTVPPEMAGLSLQASLERLRRLPGTTGGRHLLANIPGFEVITYEDGAELSRRAAIVGQTSRQTPEFSGEIEFIIFNPWWEVPASIAIRDKLPQFQRDPGAIARLGYQILDRNGQQIDPGGIDWKSVTAASFSYRIRQAPGASNALGQVKFIFPNPYDVYLHDTPEKSLFSRAERTFSSGCIRVADPIGLAEWALAATPGWDRQRIDRAAGSGRETRASLATPLPVHVVYLTAFPAADGQMSYLQDVYGRDARLLAAMAPYRNDIWEDAYLARPLAEESAGGISAEQLKEDRDHGDCVYRSG